MMVLVPWLRPSRWRGQPPFERRNPRRSFLFPGVVPQRSSWPTARFPTVMLTYQTFLVRGASERYRTRNGPYRAPGQRSARRWSIREDQSSGNVFTPASWMPRQPQRDARDAGSGGRYSRDPVPLGSARFASGNTRDGRLTGTRGSWLHAHGWDTLS